MICISKGENEMTVWIKDMGTSWFGHTFAISSERHDGIVYKADSYEEAIEAYENDGHPTVTKVIKEK